MGFQKGSITLSPGQDIPLLLQVLHSRFITHDQLFEFMLLDCVELRRRSFNWRVRRLVESGLLSRHCVRPVTPSPVYAMTGIGALMLAEHCPVLDNGKPKDVTCLVHVTHALGLNDLHLSLARQGVLEDWQSEVTIRAKNELTTSGYVKDFDAIISVRVDGRPLSFALEYERTAKKWKDYRRILGLLEQESRLRRFLYIVPETKLASFLLDCFGDAKVPLFVGLAAEFTRSFEEMNVVEASSGVTRPVTALR